MIHFEIVRKNTNLGTSVGQGCFLWVKHSNRIKPRFVVENLAAGHFQKLQVPRGRQADVDTPGKPIQC